VSVDSIIAGIIARESETFTNDPNDSGGPTKFGITLRTLSDFRHFPMTAADVQALTRGEAETIYRWKYVEQPGFARLLSASTFSKPIAEKCIDAGVLCGQQRSAEWLQRQLNALNRQGKDYADIPVDGDCGPGTVRALVSYLDKRGQEGVGVLLEGLQNCQGMYLLELAERRPKDEDFYYGWLLNRVCLTTGVAT
jgi:lysozyme family protein